VGVGVMWVVAVVR